MSHALRRLQARWGQLSVRAKVGCVSVLTGAGLLFWLPPLVHGLQPQVRSAVQLSDVEEPASHASSPWRNVAAIRSAHPLLQSVRPEDLARDPFADEGPTVETGPIVPQPVDPER